MESDRGKDREAVRIFATSYRTFADIRSDHITSHHARHITMRQPRILLTLSCLLLPLSISLVSASLDSSPSNDTIADSTGNGSGNGNGNLNADNDEHQNYNKNYNAQSNKYSNQELNTNINFLNTENNNYNFFENDEDDDDHDDHDHGHGHGHDGKDLNGPEVVYTTEIVSTLTTYCPDATVLEQNGNRYTITEAGTITITDWLVFFIFISYSLFPISSHMSLSFPFPFPSPLSR